MDVIHVKNIEKYQPSYKDGRNLVWIRWDIKGIRDYKIRKLSPEGRWLFITMLCLETESKQPIPADLDWLADEARISKRNISSIFKLLQELDLIVTICNNDGKSSCPTDIHTDIHTEQKDARAYIKISIDNEEIKSVFITEEQKVKIINRYGVGVFKKYVKALNRYIEGYGKQKHYKNHYQVLLTWIDKDKVKPIEKSAPIEVPVVDEAERKKVADLISETTLRMKKGQI